MKASVLKLHHSPKEGLWYYCKTIPTPFCVIAYDQNTHLIEIQYETGEVEEWEMSHWLTQKPHRCHPPIAELEEEEDILTDEASTAAPLLDLIIAEEEENTALISQDIPRKKARYRLK
jgi:hypothetical protein